MCFHTIRLGSKILEEVGSEKSDAGEDKVREKFVYTAKMGNNTKFVRPSNFGQKAEFVYTKLSETVALNIRPEYI